MAHEVLTQENVTLASPPVPGVYSEVGLLQQVLVHTPGPEMALVSPDNRLELLFDDVLFVDVAQREHLIMCAVFETVIGLPDAVLQVGSLLRAAFDEEDARLDFVDQLCRVMERQNYRAYAPELQQLTPDELHHFALTGKSPLPIHALPSPNLMFTRDLCAVVGTHVILSRAATEARRRESVIIHTIMRHHPRFEGVRDRIITLPEQVTFEGGDLLIPNEHTVLIGHSERTSLGGVMSATQALFEQTTVENVLLVNLPKQRSCMHLDTVFTFASRTESVVFPPLIERHRNNVIHFTRGDRSGQFITEIRPNLHEALDALLPEPLTYIPCGGDDALTQVREQWTDGANLFALAPGLVVGYERNGKTFDTMREHGYRVVDAESFLSYHRGSPYHPDEKIAIKLIGTELSRGRGGPRCMTMPILRQPL